MGHPSPDQLEDFVRGQDRTLDLHVDGCAYCRRELARERRLTRALSRLERDAPPPGLTARLSRVLPQSLPAQETRAIRRLTRTSVWTGAATLAASLLLLIFAYQMIIAFQERGALDFVDLYASTPDLVSNYPAEALGALVESLPLVEMALTIGLVLVAAVLGQHWIANRNKIVG